MDKFPPVSFISTLHSEATRILYTSAGVKQGFYWSKRFAVLPFLVYGHPGTVHLPDLPYHKIPNYWKEVADLRTDIVSGYENSLVQQMMTLIETNTEDMSESVQKLQTDWKNYSKKITNFLRANFPRQLKQISEIEICVTAYGTKASFDDVDANEIQKFTCYIRHDLGIGNIVEAIIQGMLFADPLTKDFPWEAKESIADFLLDRAHKENIIPNFEPTLTGIQNNEELMKKSQKYLEGLGITFNKHFKIENQLIYLDNKIISAQITSIQHILLSLLIEKQNQIMTYNDLADILWQDEEDFSIWAINKNMQRLRTKLVSLGAEENCIQAIKGRGYTLNN